MAKTHNAPLIATGQYTVERVNELNSFDLTGEKNKTKGTSNKFYHIELQLAKSGSKAQLYTEYGPTGHVQRREWRHFNDRHSAEAEYERILKSKRRKYKDVDVAQRALGSTEAQKITKAVKLNNAGHLKKATQSSLNDGQKRIVEIFFGSQQQFVAQTLKCPLGQLTNEQIDLGRDCLNEAKIVVNSKAKLTKSDNDILLDLTNRFYALIPHNLGAGARGKMTHLILDDISKIMAKEDDLDTLLDAKAVNAILKSDDSLDAKYKTLNCQFDEVPTGSDLYKFLSGYFDHTKVSGHGYGRAKVVSIWRMERQDQKEKFFLDNAKRIGKECYGHNFAQETKGLSQSKSGLWVPSKRPDLNPIERKLYDAANVWLCWHGTRSANLVGITQRGLLIRPSGAVYTGSMFGDGKYFAWQSTKSLNYTDGGYWAGGRRNTSSRFMFLMDVALGNTHKVTHSQYFRKPPKGCHSVYGKASRGGYGGLWNDEMITYDYKDNDNQSAIKYLLEIKD
jgi:predicted DNA-binding WGR domain protein